MNRQDKGDVTIKWQAWNDGTGATQSVQLILSEGDSSFTIDPSIEFNRIYVENWDDPSNATDGGRFSASSVTISKLILPSDKSLDFDILATDGDGDVTGANNRYVHVVGDTELGTFNLKATAGDDVIAGSSLHDVLSGDSGNDIADYSDSSASISINLDDDGNASGVLGLFAAPEDGQIGGGHADGDALSSIEGIIGGHAGDVLAGNINANYISAGEGNDAIYGEGGDDILIGGHGADEITGGSGRDTFKYMAGDLDGTVDHILDFHLGADANADIIELHGLLAGANNSNLNEFLEIDNPRFDTDTGKMTADLLVDIDGADGSASPVHIATITMTGVAETATGEDILSSMLANDQVKIG